MGAWKDIDGDSGRGRIPKRFRKIIARAAMRRANECARSVHCWNQRHDGEPRGYCQPCALRWPVGAQNELFPEG